MSVNRRGFLARLFAIGATVAVGGEAILGAKKPQIMPADPWYKPGDPLPHPDPDALLGQGIPIHIHRGNVALPVGRDEHEALMQWYARIEVPRPGMYTMRNLA